MYCQAFKYLKTALISPLNLLSFKLNISDCFICSSYYLVPTPYIKYSEVAAQSLKKTKTIKHTILYDHTNYCEPIILGVITKLFIIPR